MGTRVWENRPASQATHTGPDTPLRVVGVLVVLLAVASLIALVPW